MEVYSYSNKDLTSSSKSIVLVRMVDDMSDKTMAIVVSGVQSVVYMELIGIQAAMALAPMGLQYISLSASKTTAEYLDISDDGKWVKEPKNNIDLIEKIRSEFANFGSFSIKRMGPKVASKMKIASNPYVRELNHILAEA